MGELPDRFSARFDAEAMDPSMIGFPAFQQSCCLETVCSFM